MSLELYRRGSEWAAERGILIADTKFELGMVDGKLTVCDEVLTPDSSRFWPVDQWSTGSTPPSFDKQPVRDFLDTLDWDKTPPPPPLPAEVVERGVATLRRGLRADQRPHLRRLARRHRLSSRSVRVRQHSVRDDERMTFQVHVEVTLRAGIADPEGATIERSLPALGFDEVSGVSVGKSIRFEVEADDEASARARAEELCERFLTNPVIEDAGIQVVAA